VTPLRDVVIVLLLSAAPTTVASVAAQSAPGTASPGTVATRPDKLTPAEAAAVEQRLQLAVRRAARSFDAQRALGAFYLHQGRLEAAIPHLRTAQEIDPAHYANGYDLALALLETGKLDEARAQVRRVLAVKETGELHNLLGDIEERAGHLVIAAEEYQRAAHMEATEEHLFNWGNNLVQLRAFEPAEQVFTAGLERYPKSARIHVGLGIAQYSQGRYEEAIKSFCQAVDLAPTDPRPYQFLGEMYGVAPEQAPEITRRLAHFVAVRPRNALGHLFYALSLWKGQPAAAEPPDLRRVEALLRRAVVLDPQLAKAYLELGILLSNQQRYKEAVVELRRATQLDPAQPQGHYRLAQAYQRTGQADLAASELRLFEQLKTESR
jgi:tetratricopeptide (TPR) repeat protein